MITAELPVFLYLVFLQFAAALVLSSRRGGHPRLARGILTVFLMTNAGLSVIVIFRALGATTDLTERLAYLFDDPTMYLVLAYVAARRPGPVRHAVALVLVALAGLRFYVAQPFLYVPPLPAWYSTPATWVVDMARGPGFLAAFTFLALALARGARWERLVALAFIPRVLYWGMKMWWNERADPFSALRCAVGPGCDVFTVPGNAFVLVGILSVPLVILGAILLMRGRDAVAPALALPVVAVGPVMAMVETSGEVAPNFWLTNLVTLGLVRPVFLVLAYEPSRVRAVLLRAASAAGAALLVTIAADAGAGYGTASSLLLGVLAGLLVFGLQDLRWPVIAGAPVGGSEPEAPSPAEEASAGTDRPHWERIVLSLRGSAAFHPGVPADPGWSQKTLAGILGVSVQRVSEFPGQLNATAAQKLDEHVPGWRDEAGNEPPTLVTKHRGAVKGERGARTYYRLTSWGERLAGACAVAADTATGPN